MPRSQKTRLADQLGMHFFLECEGSVSWSILGWSWAVGWGAGSRSMDVLTRAPGLPLAAAGVGNACGNSRPVFLFLCIRKGEMLCFFFHIFSRSPLGPTLPSGPQGPWGSRPLGPMGPGPHGPLRCRGLACVSSCNVRVQRPGAFWVGPGGMGAGQQMF